MMTQVTIQNTQIPVVEYQGKRVVTFAMIDKVHQRPEGTASRNFKSNRKHFIENEDFYPLDSKSIDEFRPYKIFGKSAQKGTLITETGYMMLVKSFTDDLAWTVQRELVNQYFSRKPATQQPKKLTTATKEQREPLVKAVRRLVKVAQSKGRSLGYDDAHSIINLKLGVASIEALTPEQIPQAMTLVGEIMEKVVLEGEFIPKGETETYATPEVQTITPKQKQQISEKLYKAFSGWCFTDGCRHRGYNALRVLFNLQNIDDLPADDFQKALNAIDVMKDNNGKFLSAVVDIRNDYIKNYLFSDIPWTPDLKRKWKNQTNAKLPKRPDWQAINLQLEEADQ